MAVKVGAIPTVVVGLIAFSILVVLRCDTLSAGAPSSHKKEEIMNLTGFSKKRLFTCAVLETIWALGTSSILSA